MAQIQIVAVNPELDPCDRRQRMPADVVLGIDQLDSQHSRLVGRGGRVADGRDFIPPYRPVAAGVLEPVPAHHERNPLPEATDRDEGGPGAVQGQEDSAGDLRQAEQGNPTAQIGIAQHHAQEAQEKERRVEE